MDKINRISFLIFVFLSSNGHVAFRHGPQLLIILRVLLNGLDGALLAGLSALGCGRETALNHLLLQDIKNVPERVSGIFLTERGQEVINRSLVNLSLLITLTNLVGRNSQVTLLLVGEDGITHGNRLLTNSGNCSDSLIDHLEKLLKRVVDVADGESGELCIGNHQAVGTYATVETHHKLEGAEPVVTVLNNDADIGLGLTVRARDSHVVVLHSDHVEAPNALGTLLGSALLGLDRIPAHLFHVFDDGGGIGLDILARNARIGGGNGKSVRTSCTDLFLGHRGAKIIGKGNHCTHISQIFWCYTILYTKTVPNFIRSANFPGLARFQYT